MAAAFERILKLVPSHEHPVKYRPQKARGLGLSLTNEICNRAQ
jgi:hypothetical protein